MSKDSHNEGQEDSSDGKYDPPHSSIVDLVNDMIGGESKQDRENREDYDKGHHHTSTQKGRS
jgi:hypothetical protein